MRVVERAERITVSRPVLRVGAGALLLLIGVGMGHDTLLRGLPPSERPNADQGWYLIASFFVLAAVYSYEASTLEVSSNTVVVNNPLRRIVIPIGHVTAVKAGQNLRLETDYGHAYAWGVEASKLDLALDRLPKQRSLSETIMTRADARRTVDAATPPARYQWTYPPLLVVILAPVYVLSAIAIPTGWHPIP